LKFSRLLVPRKAGEDFVVGLLSLHDPLGLEEDGRDLVACFRHAAAAREAASVLALRGIRSEIVTDIPEGDPLEAFRAASRPFPVGRRFWLDPGEPSDSSPPEGRIALRLPASRAFGTGGHESTRLALVALEEEGVEGRTVLDVGTGSGVLALAAAALGSPRAVAYDTDVEAIFVARENLRRHAFGCRVLLAAAPAEAIGGTYAVVVANLLPDELFSIRTEVLGRVAPGGTLILSGIPAERETEVKERMRSRRFALSARRSENEWTSLCLERAS
jgi:ribosomal protein L11 methyltransferase